MTTANTLDLSQSSRLEDEQPEDGGQARHEGGVNVGQQERWISAGAGGLLALYGLKRMNLSGLVLAGVGAMLVQRALSGNCKVYQALGISTADKGEGAAPEEYFEKGIHVEEAVTVNKPAAELYSFWRKF